jgi:hypothetical protein
MTEQEKQQSGIEAEYPSDYDPSKEQSSDVEHSKGKGVYPGAAGQSKVEGETVDPGTGPTN